MYQFVAVNQGAMVTRTSDKKSFMQYCVKQMLPLAREIYVYHEGKLIYIYLRNYHGKLGKAKLFE